MSSAEIRAAKAKSWWTDAIPPRNSLAWRLAVWHAATAFVVVLAAVTTLYAAMIAQTRWVDDQVLEKRAHSVQELLQSQAVIDQWLTHEVSEDLEGPRQLFMRVLGPDGAVWAETPQMSDAIAPTAFPDARSRPFDRPARATVTTSAGRVLRVLSMRVPARALGENGEAVIQTAIDTSLDQTLLGRFRAIIFAVFACALVVCVLAGLVLSRRLLRPLQRLTNEANVLDVNAAGRRLSEGGLTGELGDLAGAFNNVLERLEAANEGLRRYADDISHEIRSPLNRMLLNAELAVREPRSESEYREIVERQVEECRHLSQLVQRLLFLARAENKQLALEKVEFDVGVELEKIRVYFESSAVESGVKVVCECPAGLRLSADLPLFQRVITNLAANALAHTPANGAVSLQARAVDQGVEIVIADTGEGIAAEHLTHLFDRFYRADHARSGEEGRVGLGLAVAKSIVVLHGGEISVTSAIGKGTQVRTSWPSSSPRSD